MSIDIDKFFKVVNLTTSDVDGEALAAIRRANSMLKKADTTWEMVILGHPRKASFTSEKQTFYQEAPKPKSRKRPKSADHDEIKQMFEVVRARELGQAQAFIDSIYNFWLTTGILTPKQRSGLEKFYERS